MVFQSDTSIRNLHYSTSKVLLLGLMGIVLFLSALFLKKGEVVLLINSKHAPVLDFLFQMFSWYGNAVVFVGFIVLLLFVRFGLAWKAFWTLMAVTFVVRFFKKVVFPDLVRPKRFFTEEVELYFVPGFEVHGFNTFPSGHTTTAFALTTLIFLFVKNSWVRTIALVFAIGAGISRMYLLQHFYQDVVAGSILGVTLAFSVCYLVDSSRQFEWYKLQIPLKSK